MLKRHNVICGLIYLLLTLFASALILSDFAIAASISSTIFPSGMEDDTSGYSSPAVDISQYLGASVISIPISVPPGRAAIQPNLAMQYNSNRHDGWLGVGWELEMGAIKRSLKRGVNYSSFNFEIDGKELVPVNINSYGDGEYRLKIEGSFSCYIYNHTSGWVITSKTGLKYYYGQTAESRQNDPNNLTRVFKWCLDRMEDLTGNYMTIAYTKNNGQIYMDQIDYTGYTNLLAPTNYVKFILEPRTDNRPVFSTNALVKTTLRLKEIRIYGNGLLSRKYVLNYSYSSGTNRSLLTSVTPIGNDGITTLSDLAATWQQGSDLEFTSNYNPISGVLISGGVKLYYGDWNGDGITDVMWYDNSSGTNRWYLNNGTLV